MFANANELISIFIIFGVLKCVTNAPIYNHKAVEVLIRYGYLTLDSVNDDLVKEDVLREAIRNFQNNAGLKITGKLDEDTLKILFMPRCGVLDKSVIGDESRIKRYATQGRPMPHQNVTYKITKYSKKLKPFIVDEIIYKAFSIWSKHTNLNFSQKKYGDTDINIRFEELIHDDFSFRDRIITSFDGPGGTLAHSFLDFDGTMQIHFDDEEYWTVGNGPGTSFLQIATHEIGHTLALDHSKVYGAIMYPFYYARYESSLDLHPDDIEGIQSLYGKRNSNNYLKNKVNTQIDIKNENPIKKWVEEFLKNKNLQIDFTPVTTTSQKPTTTTTVTTTTVKTTQKPNIETTTSGKRYKNWFDEYEFTIHVPPAEDDEDYGEISDSNPTRDWLHLRRVDDVYDNESDDEDELLDKFEGFKSFSEEVDKFFKDHRKSFFGNDRSIRYDNDIGYNNWKWNDNFDDSKSIVPRSKKLIITYW